MLGSYSGFGLDVTLVPVEPGQQKSGVENEQKAGSPDDLETGWTGEARRQRRRRRSRRQCRLSVDCLACRPPFRARGIAGSERHKAGQVGQNTTALVWALITECFGRDGTGQRCASLELLK